MTDKGKVIQILAKQCQAHEHKGCICDSGSSGCWGSVADEIITCLQPKQEWLDKPDSEGWWWYQPPKGSSHMRPGFYYLLNKSYVRVNEVSVSVDDFDVFRTGQWQKVIMPQEEKE